jgi:hypothetical protein
MIARLENNSHKLYSNSGDLVGKINIKPKSSFKEAEILLNGKNYKIDRNKWLIKVSENNKVTHNLKMNSFSGNTEILETKQKIKGMTSLKWGTKLVDNENNTLLKIRHQNLLFNNNNYVIDVSNQNVNDLDVLLTLYGHIYGSRMKLFLVMIIIIGVIASGIVVQG